MLAFLDCNNLGYRAYHTTGSLAHGNDLTGVAYGILNQLFTLLQQAPQGIDPVFCWDSPVSLRKKIYPEYKKRGKQTEEAAAKRLELYTQFDQIRTEVLPALGWGSRQWQREGYEADDLMAWGAIECDSNCIIVSGDEDLYQCLYRDADIEVMIWNPGKNEFVSASDLLMKYGCTPDQWAIIKAIAGCSGDNVPGVPGVGEKTAARFINGHLKTMNKKYRAINDWQIGQEYIRNLKLVGLPYPGLDDPLEVDPMKLDSVELKRSDFYDVFKKYGMQSFIKRLDQISIMLRLT